MIPAEVRRLFPVGQLVEHRRLDRAGQVYGHNRYESDGHWYAIYVLWSDRDSATCESIADLYALEESVASTDGQGHKDPSDG